MTMGHSRPFDECIVTIETASASASGRPSACELGVLPAPPHGAGEFCDSARGIRAGHLQHQLDICQGALGAVSIARFEDRSGLELLDSFGHQLVRRRPSRLPGQVLQDRERLLQNRVPHQREIGPEMERTIAAGRVLQPKDLVGDFFFGQADERTAQQRAQGKGVAPVGDGPCHRDQVLDFLAVEESLARLGGDWDGAAFQRPLIDPQAGPVGASRAMSPARASRKARLSLSQTG